MGGRGMMRNPPNERVQTFKATGTIDGIKVLEPINKTKKKWNLPSISNTPGTSYLKLTKDGNISRIQEYGADRLPVIAIDFTHDHGWGIPHAHDYYKGNIIKKKGRSLTLAERQKYAKTIKRAGY